MPDLQILAPQTQINSSAPIRNIKQNSSKLRQVRNIARNFKVKVSKIKYTHMS